MLKAFFTYLKKKGFQYTKEPTGYNCSLIFVPGGLAHTASDWRAETQRMSLNGELWMVYEHKTDIYKKLTEDYTKLSRLCQEYSDSENADLEQVIITEPVSVEHTETTSIITIPVLFRVKVVL